MRRFGIAVLLVLLIAVIGSAIGVVYARQESRSMFVELTRLTGERDDLNFEYGRLELEQATAAEANRVEQIARTRFGMVSPQPATTVVIKRQEPH
ncbi:MAG TPA: cell division protein FtsL [Paraburkholderia sp.]